MHSLHIGMSRVQSPHASSARRAGAKRSASPDVDGGARPHHDRVVLCRSALRAVESRSRDSVAVIVQAQSGSLAPVAARVRAAGGRVTRSLSLIHGLAAEVPSSALSVLRATPRGPCGHARHSGSHAVVTSGRGIRVAGGNDLGLRAGAAGRPGLAGRRQGPRRHRGCRRHRRFPGSRSRRSHRSPSSTMSPGRAAPARTSPANPTARTPTDTARSSPASSPGTALPVAGSGPASPRRQTSWQSRSPGATGPRT